MVIRGYKDGKDAMVDVSVTSPFCSSYITALDLEGAGAVAAIREKAKLAKYKDIDSARFIMVPFVVETTGALGSMVV